MKNLLLALPLLSALFPKVVAQMPTDKIYGVNLGSWLLLEPWMLPEEWIKMGGDNCTDCTQCVKSEFSLAEKYPDTVDERFAGHWDTWFTQDDLKTLVAAGINTVRIPLGYWLVEDLVDRTVEYYPRGGLKYLRRGLGWLRDAGVRVILDHHALPGVQVPGQMFTGQCTDDVQFYTPYNYHRALVWTAVMTTLTHLDPIFSSVFSIEAVNEPITDATQTPGYGDFQKNFVKTIRAVEAILGISVDNTPQDTLDVLSTLPSTGFTVAMHGACQSNIFNQEVTAALLEAIPMLVNIGLSYDLQDILTLSPFNCHGKEPIVTNFMDVTSQYNNSPNPADAAIGPQAYDHHVYYSFQGVADANSESYLTTICNDQHVQQAAALGNTPMWFGEWAISTNFDPTDEFLNDWADAQKWVYSKSAGWIFWSFKIEVTEFHARTMSYLEGLRRGYLTKDPSQYHNPNVCAPYIKTSTSKKLAKKQRQRLARENFF
ncbi:glycoside hydrolase family 5 protein [Scleroderma citrinum Foug A]|uniref:Glycoside hydrolase family 5 protein n=1 Tax=Scleroderma citrinum Foug A TaxID=1036808 RepID=A0A0C2ZGD3_9AGAM|nr:glycoside hydrolase family 5 protein [Scleroderma citrinum Foug A]